MALTYVSCDPSDGAVDWYINKSITVTFNSAIDTTTINQGTINIIDIVSGVSVDVIVSRSSVDPTKVIITPKTLLKENTNYRIIVVGQDIGLGVYVKNVSSENLSTTSYINFSTGDTVYQIDEQLQKDASDMTLEGDLFLPSNLKALGYDFTVSYVRPKNHTYDVPPTITGDNTVSFKFSKELLTGQDLTTWADVSAYQTINNDDYLVSGTTFGVSIPGYSIEVTGEYLKVVFDSELPKNLSVAISLTDNITASDGTEYNGEMDYGFITALYPKVAGAELIKREIRPIAEYYTDEYIAALLHKNTIWLWERMGRSIDISSLPNAAKQYIIYSTVLELVEDVDLAKWVKNGVNRRLGDFGISINTVLGSVAIKVARYQKAKDTAFESLNRGWSFRVGTTSAAYEEAAADVSRLWYSPNNRYTSAEYKFYQEDGPSSNIRLNREAKTNNPFWW